MITTLHELCGDLLRTEILESELLDRDAMESKNVQLLHILESVEEAIQHHLHTHKAFLSPSFAHFLESEDKWSIAQLLQHEIAIVIKGRAGEDLEKYKRLTRPLEGLPLENDADRGFAFLIYSSYQRKLRDAGQFDTDDIVLSAVGQLDTPIWRRRRAREGFDSIFIDETHLFNLNELSVFHFLTRSETALPIAYSVDRSQAIGDRGWTAALFEEALRRPGVAADGTSVTGMTAVFRCSPDIVNLAFSVTSSGATLFANFEDPLKLAQSSFTEDEEKKSRPPEMRLYPNDESMVSEVFQLAEELSHEMNVDRAAVAIVAFSDEIFGSLREIAASLHKPVEILRRWGDVEVIRQAKQFKRFVLGTADYIGGLEFDAVILVGVDAGRVPPTGMVTEDSRNFVTFASLSRLYVAITRARYRVIILGTQERGPSTLLSNALASKALRYVG
jgi:superfamily I DNA/RNA helicase